jgi:hypothetical protein
MYLFCNIFIATYRKLAKLHAVFGRGIWITEIINNYGCREKWGLGVC